MGNIVKFSTPVSANSIKSGGFNIGVNGTPADLTGFYTGICPVNGGYTIYIDKASNGPSIYAPQNDTDLVNITKTLGGNVSTAAEALVWINSQSNMTVVNSNYPSIVTSGLVLNLDAGFVSSYPKTGTSWRDLSGNGNNSTLVNGPSYNSSDNGSISFDGTNDYSTTFTTPLTLQGNPNFTVCAWMRRTGEGGSNTGTWGLSGDGNGINSWWSNNNNQIAIDTWGQATFTTGVTYPLNEWVFVAWQKIAGNMTRDNCILWRNLVSYTGTQLTVLRAEAGPPNIGNNGINIGRISQTYSTPVPIQVASFSVYNRVLSPAEIQQNYYAGLQRFIPTNGLVLSLDAQNTNLYATSPTTAYDISGNGNNGTLINGVSRTGDADTSWRFDGVDDRILVVSNVLITNDFTFTVWAKRDGNSSTGIGGIFGNHIHTELSGANIYFTNNSTTVTMSAGNGVTRPAHNVSIPRLNTLWNFYVIRYSGTTYQLYFNGVLLDSRTATVVQSLNTNKYSLGVWALSYLSEYYLNGKISECSTYNRALTQTEITTIFNATRTRYGI